MGYSELNCLIIDKFLLNRYTPRLHPLSMQRNLNRRLLVRLLDQNGVAELNRNNARTLFYLARKKSL